MRSSACAPSGGHAHLVAARLEAAREHVAVELVVVNDQHVAAGAELRLLGRDRGRLDGRLARGRGGGGVGGRLGWGAVEQRGAGREEAIDELELGARGRRDLLEIGPVGLLAVLLALLDEQLRVADDLVDRRAKVVASLRERIGR
jgi:hypothetical protein